MHGIVCTRSGETDTPRVSPTKSPPAQSIPWPEYPLNVGVAVRTGVDPITIVPRVNSRGRFDPCGEVDSIISRPSITSAAGTVANAGRRPHQVSVQMAPSRLTLVGGLPNFPTVGGAFAANDEPMMFCEPTETRNPCRPKVNDRVSSRRHLPSECQTSPGTAMRLTKGKRRCHASVHVIVISSCGAKGPRCLLYSVGDCGKQLSR